MLRFLVICYACIMASIFTRNDSPHYWLRFKSPQGTWKAKATTWMAGNPLHRAKAIEEAARISVNERRPKIKDDWILPFIMSYQANLKTIIHYRNSWRWLELYLTHRGITAEQFSPSEAEAYISWRTQPTRRVSGRAVHRNQALRDIKIMKWIHRQGRLLGHWQMRDLDDYRLRYAPNKRIKPPFTDEQIGRVRQAMANMPPAQQWMRVAFEIGLATGCRLSETQIPMHCIDLTAGTITFPTPKGGPAKAFTIPIPKALIPMLTAMKKAGLRQTCTLPPCASREFRVLFNRLGLYLHCFHSLRVTRASNLRRAGVPLGAAMRLLNHGSELIHETYVRHDVADLRAWIDFGQPPPAANGQNPRAAPAPTRWGTRPAGLSPTSSRKNTRMRPPAPAGSSLD